MNPTQPKEPTYSSLRVRRLLFGLLSLAIGSMSVAMESALAEVNGASVTANAVRTESKPTDRVRRDASGRWVIDGSLIDLSTVNIAPGQDVVFDTTLPKGLRPIELRGRFIPAVSVTSSNLDIGLLAQAPSAIASGGPRTFAVSARPEADSPSDPYVAFSARTTTGTACPVSSPAQIDSISIVAEGNPTPPSSLADFFPPFLDRLVLRLDPTRNIDERTAQAVLNLTTFVVQKWPNARVIVANGPLSLSPYDRQIYFEDGDRGSLSLRERGEFGSGLVLAGPHNKIDKIAEFVASSDFTASLVRTLTTDGKVYALPEIGHTLTIGDLRGSALTVKGIGTVEQVIPLTQAQLGGQISSISVNISGVAQTAGSGNMSIQLRANGQILASTRVANEEPFNVKGTIARSTLRRDNVITIRATEVSTGLLANEKSSDKPSVDSSVGRSSQSPANDSDAGVRSSDATDSIFNIQGCPSGRHEVTMQLDPGSVFDASIGRGLAAGFERFPQALLPRFDLRFSALTVDELRAAVESIQLLQSISVPRLVPEVFGPNRKHSPGRPTFYVGPTTAELEKLKAPILPPMTASTTNEAQTALEGFAGNGDDHVALVTNGKAGLLVETLLEPTNDPAGWRSLKGDVLIHQNGEVKNLRLRQTRDGEVRGRVVEQTRIGHALIFGFGSGWIVALASGLTRFLRRRRGSSR